MFTVDPMRDRLQQVLCDFLSTDYDNRLALLDQGDSYRVCEKNYRLVH